MISSTLHNMVLPLCLLIALDALPARGVLKADGIIRVKGAEITSTTITVVPGHANAYTLSVGIKHISLVLPLDDVYLISVESVGCPTKEVYFDTRVPVEMHALEFNFPFMVTLEHLDPEHMFAYAAPVGFVRYMHELKDFGYETQYVVAVQEELKERLRTVRSEGVDPKVMVPMAQAHVIDRVPGEYHTPTGLDPNDQSSVAPMVNEVPRLVHVLSANDEQPSLLLAETLKKAIEPEELSSNQVASALSPSDANHSRLRYATTRTARTKSSVQESIDRRSVLVPKVQPPTPATKELGLLDGRRERSEEVVSEARRVTHIVRFTLANGQVHEYRKVVHAFGGVYFFQDGISISERMFKDATDVDLTLDQ